MMRPIVCAAVTAVMAWAMAAVRADELGTEVDLTPFGREAAQPASVWDDLPLEDVGRRFGTAPRRFYISGMIGPSFAQVTSPADNLLLSEDTLFAAGGAIGVAFERHNGRLRWSLDGSVVIDRSRSRLRRRPRWRRDWSRHWRRLGPCNIARLRRGPRRRCEWRRDIARLCWSSCRRCDLARLRRRRRNRRRDLARLARRLHRRRDLARLRWRLHRRLHRRRTTTWLHILVVEGRGSEERRRDEGRREVCKQADSGAAWHGGAPWLRD
jgi:hypothetical protein